MAEFANGSPALVERRFGDGVVVTGGVPGRTRVEQPAAKPEFVPLVLRLVGHVQHRPEVEAPSVVPADGVAEFSVTAAWTRDAQASVTDPAGRPTEVALEKSGSRLVGAFERTGQRRYYALEVKGGQGERAKASALAFAVNLAPEESEFKLLEEKQLRELLPSAQLTFVDASAEAQALHGSIGDEREIWRPLIWLMFAVIGLEFTLATLGGQKPETGEALDRGGAYPRVQPRDVGGPHDRGRPQGGDGVRELRLTANVEKRGVWMRFHQPPIDEAARFVARTGRSGPLRLRGVGDEMIDKGRQMGSNRHHHPRRLTCPPSYPPIN